MALATREGLLVAIALAILPLGILWALIKLLPPWASEASPGAHDPEARIEAPAR